MRTVDRLGDFLAQKPRAYPRAELVTRFSRHSLDAAVARGTAVRMAPGVYASPQWRRHTPTRAHAASLWGGPACAVGGLGALAILGATDAPVPGITLVTSRPNHRDPPAGVRLLRTRVRQRGEGIDGVRVVSAIDAVIQAWGERPPADRIGGTLDAMRRLGLAGADIAGRLDDYPRVPARRALIRLLGIASSGVTSYLEYVARTRTFATPAFADLHWQAPVRAGHRRFVLDMAHLQAKVGIEFDGRAFHSDDGSRRRDLERDALLAAHGFVVLRLTYEDVVHRPAWCRTQVRRAISARLPGRLGG